MNSFWGQSRNIQKLSRDDDQLIALNYENLCDADYLNRLFTLQSGNEDINQPEQRDAESWILTADIAEDIMIFGDGDLTLGTHLLQKRFLRNLSHVNTDDTFTALIRMQVIVFDNISRLVETSCLSQERQLERPVYHKDYEMKGKSSDIPLIQKNLKNLAFEALNSALKALELQSRTELQRSAVDPMISLVIDMYQDREDSLVSMNTGTAPILTENKVVFNTDTLVAFREILCNGVRYGINSFNSFCEKQLESCEKQIESIKLSLSCAYGLLAIGIYSESPNDSLTALFYLISISTALEEATVMLNEERDLEVAFKVGLEMGLKNQNQNNIEEPQIMNEEIFEIKDDYNTRGIIQDQDQQKNNLVLKLKSKNSQNQKNLSNFLPLKNNGIKSVVAIPIVSITEPPKPTIQQMGLSHQNSIDELNQINITKKIATWDNIIPKKTSKIFEKIKEKEKNNQNENYPSRTKILPFPKKNSILSKIQRLNSKSILSKNNNHNDEDVCIPIYDNKFYSDSYSEKSSLMNNELSDSQHHYKTLRRNYQKSLKSLSKIPKCMLRIVNHNLNDSTETNNIKSKSIESYVWSCGQNSYGELGHGDGITRKIFTKINYLEDKGVVSVGAGNEHSVFVCTDGKVFVTGYNDNGQCGSGKTEQVKLPQQVYTYVHICVYMYINLTYICINIYNHL
jgi:hypothetical protein